MNNFSGLEYTFFINTLKNKVSDPKMNQNLKKFKGH